MTRLTHAGLALTLALSCGLAAAQEHNNPIRLVPHPVTTVPAPAATEPPAPQPLREQVVTLPLADAEPLLQQNKAGWSVLRITAPKDPKQCKLAKAFGKKFSVNLSEIQCLALYPSTTVWLLANPAPSYPAPKDASGPLVSQEGDMRFVPEPARRSNKK